MNYVNLKWEHSPRGNTVDFMDLTVTITNNNSIETTLFEKKLNLYLYIPPHSAHPPGVLNGLVLGNTNRIYTLCSNQDDTKRLIKDFYARLADRGYTRDKLLPLFQKAHRLATRPRSIPLSLSNIPPTTETTETNNRLFFHIRYNPFDPKSSRIQDLWKRTVLNPRQAVQLKHIRNLEGHRTEIDRLTIAYSRPLNLGNMLSYRNLDRLSGPPVSSYQTITN